MRYEKSRATEEVSRTSCRTLMSIRLMPKTQISTQVAESSRPQLTLPLYTLFQEEKASSKKSMLRRPTRRLTAARTLSLNPPGPHTVAAIAPTCARICSSTISWGSHLREYTSARIGNGIESVACGVDRET